MAYCSNHGGAVKAVLFMLCFFTIGASRAEDDVCEPQKFEPGVPATLPNKYEIIGRMPGSDVTYGGTLEISEGKTSYTLKRIVNGNVATGQAWLYTCRHEGYKFETLNFEYTQGKSLLHGYCFTKSTHENSMLFMCYTNFVGAKNDQHGLESLFPLDD